jgi:hypothetical protein
MPNSLVWGRKIQFLNQHDIAAIGRAVKAFRGASCLVFCLPFS